MQLNTERILTTHTGSLPRPQEVLDLLFAQDRDEPYDANAFESAVARAVESVVTRQRQAGVDVVSDGEMSKISYATYVRHRLTGFTGDSPRPTPRDLEDFPTLRDRLLAQGKSPVYRRPVCTGPIAAGNGRPLEMDIARMTKALSAASVSGGFLTSVSPGTVAVFHPNEYYATHEAYVEALANVMRTEYERIVQSGLLLQVDCPDLGLGRHSRFKHLSDAEFLRYGELHIDALNAALSGVAADRVRLHVCWGNYEGPHTHDIALALILPLLLKAKPAVLLVEGANPRHQHEWRVWADNPLPDDKALVPGVIDTSTNFVEHADLVAERIVRYADIVGRERVMAGTDCGLGTFAGFGLVEPDIAWLKLRALSEGAAIASRHLWRSSTARS
jgi:5-methyltetrahydropteroyltriglutamate--homocysteine methyltransferase